MYLISDDFYPKELVHIVLKTYQIYHKPQRLSCIYLAKMK